MAEDDNDVQQLFARIRTFGWFEHKRSRNLRDHKIDFRDMNGIFDGHTFIRRSDRDDEVRYEVFGYVNGREVAIVCTFQKERCWIISARPASRKERAEYYDHLARRSSTGED